MFNLRHTYFAFLAGVLALSAQGGPLTEARVTKIINNVQVVDPARGAHAASLQETIRDQIELKTGLKSRSELLFQDNTLTRIGPETSFSFNAGTRDMSLQRGTMLLQVPKGLGGAKIRTAAVTAAITGTTIMMEYTPSKHIKVLVLEGSLRLSINGRFGESVVLRPGRMVLMRPDAKRIPEPVSVDLKRIMKTSSLVNMSEKNGTELPSASLIEKEIAQQTREIGSADLVGTDFVIRGQGTTAMNSMGGVIDIVALSDQGRTLNLAAIVPAKPTDSPDSATPDPTPAPDSTANLIPVPAPTPVLGASPAPTPVIGASPEPTPVIGASPEPTPVIGASPEPTPVIGASPEPTPVIGASPEPTPVIGSSPTPLPVSSPSPAATPFPQPTPSPSPSGSGDDDDKGDHNDDGHLDNGNGKGKDKDKDRGGGKNPKPVQTAPPPSNFPNSGLPSRSRTIAPVTRGERLPMPQRFGPGRSPLRP